MGVAILNWMNAAQRGQGFKERAHNQKYKYGWI